jgi:C-8 sterol isomerase
MGHVFDPAVLHAAAREVIGLPLDKMTARLVEELARRYPGYIDAEANRPDKWVFNNAGGAMGAMCLLHASLTEYVILFGTAIGTEGHTGRLFADDYFMILDGEQWVYAPGELESTVYRPGELHLMRRGEARGYRMPGRCWALEYARGAIPLMLPFAMADALTSTLDWVTLARTLRLYSSAVIGQLLRGKL